MKLPNLERAFVRPDPGTAGDPGRVGTVHLIYYPMPPKWRAIYPKIILPLAFMTQREKLPAMIRQNPKAVRFDDACKVAGWLGFIHDGGQGSHRVFKRPGEPMQLNFQNCKGVIPPYQARQLIAMLDKYGG